MVPWRSDDSAIFMRIASHLEDWAVGTGHATLKKSTNWKNKIDKENGRSLTGDVVYPAARPQWTDRQMWDLRHRIDSRPSFEYAINAKPRAIQLNFMFPNDTNDRCENIRIVHMPRAHPTNHSRTA